MDKNKLMKKKKSIIAQVVEYRKSEKFYKDLFPNPDEPSDDWLPPRISLKKEEKTMVNCSGLVCEDGHFWFCNCPEMQLNWEKLDKNMSDSFRKFAEFEVGCKIYFKINNQERINRS